MMAMTTSSSIKVNALVFISTLPVMK